MEKTIIFYYFKLEDNIFFNIWKFEDNMQSILVRGIDIYPTS